ncbi:hypothetical protein DFJ73DRAFT_768565 [Zopfochytrium polystomum]|nr:hypothetical protein DFJ73DRAFT_768565 [Zopfochytrium polystomum]
MAVTALASAAAGQERQQQRHQQQQQLPRNQATPAATTPVATALLSVFFFYAALSPTPVSCNQLWIPGNPLGDTSITFNYGGYLKDGDQPFVHDNVAWQLNNRQISWPDCMNYVRGKVPAAEVDLIVWIQGSDGGCYIKKYDSFNGAAIIWGGDKQWVLPNKYFADNSYGPWYTGITLDQCANICLGDGYRCAAAMYYPNNSCIMKGFNYPTTHPNQYVMFASWQWSSSIFIGTVPPTAAPDPTPLPAATATPPPPPASAGGGGDAGATDAGQSTMVTVTTDQATSAVGTTTTTAGRPSSSSSGSSSGGGGDAGTAASRGSPGPATTNGGGGGVPGQDGVGTAAATRGGGGPPVAAAVAGGVGGLVVVVALVGVGVAAARRRRRRRRRDAGDFKVVAEGGYRCKGAGGFGIVGRGDGKAADASAAAMRAPAVPPAAVTAAVVPAVVPAAAFGYAQQPVLPAAAYGNAQQPSPPAAAAQGGHDRYERPRQQQRSAGNRLDGAAYGGARFPAAPATVDAGMWVPGATVGASAQSVVQRDSSQPIGYGQSEKTSAAWRYNGPSPPPASGGRKVRTPPQPQGDGVEAVSRRPTAGRKAWPVPERHGSASTRTGTVGAASPSGELFPPAYSESF